ncbi:Sec20-domain-containing protein [Syncephalis fuscata]|nr:Sec20-domain-containing protein [Syncephalis fuscata]
MPQPPPSIASTTASSITFVDAHEEDEQLTDLSRRALTIEQLISALHAPVDTATELPSATMLAAEQRDLAATARTQLRQFERAITDARELAEDEDREQDRIALLRQIDRHDAHRKQLQTALRKATLEGKRKADAHARFEREALLGSSGANNGLSNNRRVQSTEKAMMRASSEVTESLRRTTQLMQAEVEKSSLNATTLEDSSRLLRAAHGEYRGLDTVLRTSRQVLTRLERGDWTDRLLILFGLFVFLLVVLYVVRRRFWIPGMSWVFSSLWTLLTGSDAPKDGLLDNALTSDYGHVDL